MHLSIWHEIDFVINYIPKKCVKKESIIFRCLSSQEKSKMNFVLIKN